MYICCFRSHLLYTRTKSPTRKPWRKERIANHQLKLQSDTKIDFDDVSFKNEKDRETAQKKGSIFGICFRGVTNFQNFVHRNLNLIQLLTPMLLQDGPFLIVRLVLVSYYKVTGMCLKWSRNVISRGTSLFIYNYVLYCPLLAPSMEFCISLYSGPFGILQ